MNEGRSHEAACMATGRSKLGNRQRKVPGEPAKN
jgi:hypothetical protein